MFCIISLYKLKRDAEKKYLQKSTIDKYKTQY